MPRILLVGTKNDQPDFVERAKALGLEVVLAQRPQVLTLQQAASADQTVVADFTRPDFIDLVRALHAWKPIDAVCSLTELGLVPAALAGEALGVRGVSSRTALLLRDKATMRTVLNGRGFSPVAARPCRGVGEALEAAAGIGYPVIVKPVDGGGSIGIVRADGPGNVRAGFARLDGLGIADVIVEEFLDGPEFSVEAFSFSGRHVVLAVTEKILGANFIEMGHALPADLPEETRRTIEDFVAEFLTIVELKDGPSHTELKLTSKGPRIIESHNRLGGDKINLLVDAALGVNLVDLSFGWAAGILPALDRVPPARCSAAVRFLAAPPGRIERIEGLDRLQAAKDVLEFDFRHSVGETVGAVTENLGRPGFVAVAAPTTGEARARAEALAGEVVVTTAI